jgi:hypothetical protein
MVVVGINVELPEISSFELGELVPIPTLPLESIRARSADVLPAKNFNGPAVVPTDKPPVIADVV